MKKKIVLSNIIIALLMLASFQIAFFETVESNDKRPNEDHSIGTIWNTELDVSSLIRGFDDISIAHCNPIDRLVLLPARNGNLTVEWTVEINSQSHPEFFAAFSLFVYNIDDNNTEIGNDTFMKTYNKDSQYDENDILKVALDFSGWIKNENITLLCELGASFMLNKTREAKNFTSVAQDRCVVVVFLDKLGPRGFDMWEYRNKANYAQPCMWSWIDGWEEKFESEELMLNNQTYFQVGWNTTSEYTNGNVPWWLGWINVTIEEYLNVNFGWEPDMKHVYWDFGSDGWVEGQGRVNYSITLDKPFVPYPPITMRWYLFYDEGSSGSCMSGLWPARKTWIYGLPLNDYFKATLQLSDSHDVNNNNAVRCKLLVWAGLFFGFIPHLIEMEYNYYCHNESGAGNTPGSGGTPFYWEEDAAYSNSTTPDISNVTIFGITYVEVDITRILVNVGSTLQPSENEIIYTWRGDSRETRVIITC